MRRIAVAACIMLVTLRLAIGWQLLYEGLWKVKTLRSPTPWTAAGYLRNSQGPWRGFFRGLAGDPDDLDWLDVEKVEAKWDQWQRRFASHYQLSDRQKSTLDRWVNGSKTFEADLAEMPAEIDLKQLRLDTVVSFNPDKKRLVIDGNKHLKPDERNKLVNAVADKESEVGQQFIAAVEAAYKRSKSGISYKEKLRAKLLGNPNWVSDPEAQRVGEIDQYKSMLAAYEEDLKAADQDFRWDHLDYTWGKIQAKRSQLVGPVKALDKELKDKSLGLLTVEQLTSGPVGEPWTRLRISDLMTITGLTVLGAMLILGLGTRFAAVMAAVMMFMFYAAIPPWPGVPEAPGPEHSFIVNKNFIELIALLAIACLPTGRWFGMDGVVSWLLRRRKAKGQPVAAT